MGSASLREARNSSFSVSGKAPILPMPPTLPAESNPAAASLS